MKADKMNNALEGINRVLKNVSSDGRTRRERAKKRSLHIVYRFATPHFEHLSNTVMPSA